MASPSARKQLFYTEMAKLLEAGFGIREAARVMLETGLPSGQAALLREMDAGLEAGRSITEAFVPGSVTALERGIIGAGERGGRLPQAFRHLASYFGMLASARRDALAALAYPALLLHAGIFAAILAPALAGGEVGFGMILREFALAVAVLYAVGYGAWLGLRVLQDSAAENSALDRMLRNIPVLGGARRAMVMARFTKVWHTCLLAGLPMRETVQTACDASQSAIVQGAGRQLLQALGHGGALGPVMMSCGAFPPAFARSYATAEQAGGLDEDLARWAAVYQDDAARGAKASAAVISKVFYFAVLIFIGWTVISLYMGRLEALEELME